MTSKERVRAAICHKQTDRTPTDFACVDTALQKLMLHYNFSDAEQLYNKFDIDIRTVGVDYIGPEMESFYENGVLIRQTIYGFKIKRHWNGMDYNDIPYNYPLDKAKTISDIERHSWPNPDSFDYESIKYAWDKYRNKALIIGDAGVYQFATYMRQADKLYMDMALEPEFAKRIFDKFVEFELEYYERILIAAEGQIDILRCYDDYGTQTGLLFSMDMWRNFFKDNTKKLADLAHKYGAYYMQHSCGAIRSIIPELIACGVDIIDPVQKAAGMEPEGLKKDYGNEITFHGGIDTQWLLPCGTPEEVERETRRYIDIMGKNGGYILCPSQEIQPDIPVENIEAMYRARD